jgi:hypothetical protein
MITKDDINEKDMIDAINEIEVLYRVYDAKNEDNWSEEDYPKGFRDGQGEILADIKVILDLLEQKKYKKPEIVK